MENQRVIISKRMLKDALLSLLKEKRLMDVTVKELCERSGINRSTFYRHYDNVSDLLDEVIDDIVNLLVSTSNSSLNDPGNTLSYLSNTLLFFRDHDEYDPLISSENFTMDILGRKIEEEMINSLPIKSSRHQRYLIRYLMNGSYGIIKSWIMNGRKEDVKEISDMILTFTSSTFR